MKKLILMLSLGFFGQNIHSQIVPNGYFEDVTGTVTNTTQIEKAIGWQNISNCYSVSGLPGSPDLLSCNSTNSNTGVPNNQFTSISLNDFYSGCNYAHIYRQCHSTTPVPKNDGSDGYYHTSFTEVMQSELNEYLLEGCYDFSMVLALAEAYGNPVSNANNIVKVYLTNGQCNGASKEIFSSGNIQSLNWSQANSTFSLDASESGIYNHIRIQMAEVLIVNLSQSVFIDGLSITFTEPVSITADESICIGESTTLTANGASTNYLWNTGETTHSISVSPTVSTTYTVTGTTTSGCATTDNITINVNPLPSISNNFEDVTLCANDNFPVTLIAGKKGGGTIYSWTYQGETGSTVGFSNNPISMIGSLSGATGSTATVNLEGEYCVTASSISTGCSAAQCVTVEYDPRLDYTPEFEVVAVCSSSTSHIDISALYDPLPAWPVMCYTWDIYEVDANGNTTLVANNPSTWWNNNTGQEDFTGFVFDQSKEYKIRRGIFSCGDLCIPMTYHTSDIIKCNTGGFRGRTKSHAISTEEAYAMDNVKFENEINSFPNPTNGIFTVQLNSSENGTLQVFDYTGKVVLEQIINGNSLQLDISEMPSGLYFVQVASEGKQQKVKIIKE